MKKTTIVLILTILFLNPYSVNSQLLEQKELYLLNAMSQAQNLSPSPEIAAMQRYGYYPVNYSVGLPDVSIPIYTIKGKQLEYPITLSYHMGGVRVDDIASWVGLGWSLNTSGAISRALKGGADENKGFLTSEVTIKLLNGNKKYITSKIPVAEEDFNNVLGNSLQGELHGNFSALKLDYFGPIESGKKDGQSDIYTYKVHDLSGEFAYNMKRELIHFPHSNNKVDRNLNDNSFTIVSDNGTIYKFENKDTETAVAYIANHTRHEYVSSWLISEIISADLTDTIRFKYTAPTEYKATNIVSQYSDGTLYESNPKEKPWGFKYPNKIKMSRTFIDSYSRERLLSSIEFANGSVHYNLSSETRKDPRNYKLGSITVKNKQNAIIKTIKFDYDYFMTEVLTPKEKVDYRLKLNEITINDHIYKFSYNSTKLPPYISSSIFPKDESSHQKRNNAQDFWGFYNGEISNSNKIVLPLDHKDKMANRNSSESHMKACSLERIDYPTGGYSIFKMEANKIQTDEEKDIVRGGLRVATITSKANDHSPEIIKTFEYEEGEEIFPIDRMQYSYNMYNVWDIPSATYTDESSMRRFYTENPFNPIAYFQGSPVIYGKVTEYVGSIKNNRTVYYYNSPRTTQHFINYYGGAPIGAIKHQYQYLYESLPWTGGNLIKQEYYEDGVTIPVKIITNKYSASYSYQTHECIGKGVYSRLIQQGEIGFIDNYYMNAFNYYGYYYIMRTKGDNRLYETIDETYDKVSNKYISSSVKYNYEDIPLSPSNNRFLLTEKTSSTSELGHKIIETYNYPHNYSSLSPYKEMVNKNMLSLPVDKVIYKNDKKETNEISREKIDYGFFNASKIYPKSILTARNGASNLRAGITYNHYDTKGNLAQYTGKDEVPVCFIWSYNGQYPIAEIKNISYSKLVEMLSKERIERLLVSATPSDSDLKAINELRSNPTFKDALITTYTYKPLVGMLTSTDPSGITTYYNYDSFGRLFEIYTIEDNIKKVLEFYLYNYQNK